MNYIKEILGNRYMQPKDWEAKKVREAEEFKVRLASLSPVAARGVCIALLAMPEGVHHLISAIARAFLANETKI